jgi:hypothetical protein
MNPEMENGIRRPLNATERLYSGTTLPLHGDVKKTDPKFSSTPKNGLLLPKLSSTPYHYIMTYVNINSLSNKPNCA